MCLLCEGVQRLFLCVREMARVCLNHHWKNETGFHSPTCPRRSSVVLTFITKTTIVVEEMLTQNTSIHHAYTRSRETEARKVKFKSCVIPSVVSAEVLVWTVAAAAAAAAGTAKLQTATQRC